MSELKNLLREIGQGYTDQPAFLLQSGDELLSVSFERFFRDVCRQELYYRRTAWSRMGIWGFNSYDWIVSAIGLLLAGKHLILFDGNLTNQDLLLLAEYTDTELLVAEPDLMEEQEALEGRLHMQPYVCEEECSARQDIPAEQSSSLETDFICFTSGTSKSAKGVVITTESLAGWIRMAEGTIPGRRGERYFLPIPFHHIYSFTELFHILKQGGTVYVGRGGRYLLQDMERYRPHVAFVVPSMLQFLLKKNAFFPPFHTVLTGGSFLRPALADEVKGRGIELYNLYGLSETMGAVCSSKQGQDPQWMSPFPNIWFVEGEDGEVGIHLPFPMKEYYKKEEDTQAVLDWKNDIFWTGDAGEWRDGMVRIRGRMRDTIVLENGEKIHAEDVDSQLLTVAGVKEAAVISADGILAGVVVPEPGALEADIRRGLEQLNRKKTADTRIRKLWLRREPLPRTAAGKLQRYQIEQEYLRSEGLG